MPRIAVDAMGGALAPEEVVRGVAQASRETDIQMVVVGNADRIQALLDGDRYNPELISVRHCTSWIGPDEDPREALRAKRDASIAVAMRLVSSGEADAVVSAGPTGACLLAGTRHLKAVPGLSKVALASVFPRRTDHPGQDELGLLLDVGSTIRCEPLELVQFAAMGSAYARCISKTAAPRVGLLNMAADEGAGGEVLAEVHRRLRSLPTLHFVGNVEGNELATGKADVIVAEGLLGNVVLKLIEAAGELAVDIASRTAPDSWRSRLGMSVLSSSIVNLRALTDLRTYGGAPILGLEHVVVKAHARSTAPAICNAVKVAAKGVRDGVARQVADALAAVR